MGSSDLAHRVLDVGIRLAELMPGAHLHVVHVLPDLAATAGKSVEHMQIELLREFGETRVAHACEVAQRRVVPSVAGHLLYGEPASAIATLVRDLHAEVLVLGPSDRVPWRRAVFGSVLDRLLREAPCHVLVAQPEWEPTEMARSR